MRLLRMAANLVMALVLIVLTAGVFAVGYAYVAVDAWEYEEPLQENREGTWLQVNGEPVHLSVAGPENGPAVVLLHGSDIEGGLTFHPNIKALGLAGVRVIAVDFPGYGYSTRAQDLGYMTADQVYLLEQLLTALNIRQVTLVGFQRGCAVALGYALEHSQDVRQVALISPLVYEAATPLPRWAASLPILGKALIWGTTGGPLMSRTRARAMHDPSILTAAYREQVIGPTHIRGTNAFQLAWLRDKRQDLIPALQDLRDLRIPIVIYRGEYDSGQTARDAAKLAQVLTDVKVVEFAGVGRYVHQEAAQLMNNRLVQFGLHGIR